MIGQKISPILEEIENALWDHEVNVGTKTEYSPEGFRAATKIFMSVLMDKIWELQEKEGIAFEDRIKMVDKAGRDVKDIIKTYTDIDTFKLYK